jgi:hypothetical protein
MAMEKQAQRMRAAEAEQQSACASASPACSDLTTKSQSEANLYRVLQERYNQCRQASPSAYPFGGYAFSSTLSGLWFDPMTN